MHACCAFIGSWKLATTSLSRCPCDGVRQPPVATSKDSLEKDVACAQLATSTPYDLSAGSHRDIVALVKVLGVTLCPTTLIASGDLYWFASFVPHDLHLHDGVFGRLPLAGHR
jgi:hypothetical protein